MRLNVAKKIKSSLSVLIDSLQTHLSKDVLLSRNVYEFTQSMSKLNNNTKTLSMPLSLHLVETVLQRTNNAVHYLNFNAKSGVCREFPGVYRHMWVLICYCGIFKLFETAKISDKKYINVKVWLYATHQQKKRRFGILKFAYIKRIMGL